MGNERTAGPVGATDGREDGIGEFTYFSVEPATDHEAFDVDIPATQTVDTNVAADQSAQITIAMRAQAVTTYLGGPNRSASAIRIRVDESLLYAGQAADFAFKLEWRARGTDSWREIKLEVAHAYFKDLTLLPRTGSIVGRYIAAPGGWLSDTEEGEFHDALPAIASLDGEVELRVLAFPIYQFGEFGDGSYRSYVELTRESDNVGDRAVAPGEPHVVFQACRDQIGNLRLVGRSNQTCASLFKNPDNDRTNDAFEAYCDDLVRNCVHNTQNR